jgi:hypothetical protein
LLSVLLLIQNAEYHYFCVILLRVIQLIVFPLLFVIIFYAVWLNVILLLCGIFSAVWSFCLLALLSVILLNVVVPKRQMTPNKHIFAGFMKKLFCNLFSQKIHKIDNNKKPIFHNSFKRPLHSSKFTKIKVFYADKLILLLLMAMAISKDWKYSNEITLQSN